ncbi:MAG: hypothetical protein K0R98_779 [Rickettsiaceae bacterium]|jgi:hypothetical protein|nr:hypothetical protein [Rickettsiaceae bacterium]
MNTETTQALAKAISTMQIQRIPKWVKASSLFVIEDDISIEIEIQKLGQCEVLILDMESKIEEAILSHTSGHTGLHKHQIENIYLDAQINGFSQYWIYGLYETLRTFKESLCKKSGVSKQTFPEGEFECLNNLFFDLEVLRTPLAKHDIAHSGKYYGKTVKHNAIEVTNPNDGTIGWQVYCPERKDNIVLTRRQIADRFLERAERIKEKRT